MLEIKNVTKKYQSTTALENVSLQITKGMNFIIGSSGSGKTTLLNIMSGMENDYTGEVSYCGKHIKELTTKEKSYFYNTIFGFVWQEFNLIEDLTVMENVLLPSYLKQPTNQKYAISILKELNMSDIANKKVKQLSGGQKQRVAIARELMKNPKVILADEPTSALDEENARLTMDILRTLAKHTSVIVVTHDTTLIEASDTVFELDKGELLTEQLIKKTTVKKLKMSNFPILSFKSSFTIAKTSMKRRLARFSISIVTLMIASVMLLTTLSGAIHANTKGEFDKLIQTYGDSLLDLSVIQSFMNASGTGGNDEKKPNGDVSQNIDGIFEKYQNDPRVSYLLHIQAFDNIKITIDGKQYDVESTGNSPVVNKVLSGRIPNDSGDEVIVPESFAKKAGLDKDSILGKEIDFSSGIYNWDSGEAVLKNVKTKAKVVGVIDTKTTYEADGKTYDFSVDDSFFFTKSTIENMRKQAGIKSEEMNFFIRTTSPSSLIEIKDELNAQGIVPLGQFELVEDMVRLQEQSFSQSSSASFIIAALSLAMVMVIFLFSGSIRKKEYAIYKVNGYTTKNLALINLCETICSCNVTILLTLLLSPVLNILTKSLFHTSIVNVTSLSIVSILIILTSILSFLMTHITYYKTNIIKVLRSGGKS